jgi:hypothetical protein
MKVKAAHAVVAITKNNNTVILEHLTKAASRLSIKFDGV